MLFRSRPAKKVRWALGSRDSGDQNSDDVDSSMPMGDDDEADQNHPLSAQSVVQQVLRAPSYATLTGDNNDFDSDAPHLELARNVLGRMVYRHGPTQEALTLDPSLAQSEEKLRAMRRALQPRHVYDFAYSKEAVERQFAARGIAPDKVFNVGGRSFVEFMAPEGRAKDRKSTRLNSSHSGEARMPSSA